MNSNMGISIGWMNSCGMMKGRDDEGSGFFVIEGFGEGTEYIHQVTGS